MDSSNTCSQRIGDTPATPGEAGGYRRYYLLPFRFEQLAEHREVLVNEVGDYLFVPRGTAQKIVERRLNEAEHLYQNLVARFFISESLVPPLIDVLAVRYRTRRAFLDSFTSLHIFVITLRCNSACLYCHASSRPASAHDSDMSFVDLDSAIELMFRSPSLNLTVEFQGGEPLLAFDRVRYAVDRIRVRNAEQKRNLRFVICTNLLALSDDVLTFCKQNSVLISTSCDGPEALHTANRPNPSGYTFACLEQNIRRCQQVLGADRISALLTVTHLSLSSAIPIVDEYVRLGFRSLFLRPLNPYGRARLDNHLCGYDLDAYLEFYRRALLYIIELNLKGVLIVEEYARLILTRILTPFATGFTDLQSPAGLVNSVAVYNYDGFAYASDEGRMLAEAGDFSFRLGDLRADSYSTIFYGAKAKAIAECWANESLPGCSECAFQGYCGADPVRNYTMQGDAVGFRPTSDFCKKHRNIISFLLEMIADNPCVARVFRSWVTGRHCD